MTPPLTTPSRSASPTAPPELTPFPCRELSGPSATSSSPGPSTSRPTKVVEVTAHCVGSSCPPPQHHGLHPDRGEVVDHPVVVVGEHHEVRVLREHRLGVGGVGGPVRRGRLGGGSWTIGRRPSPGAPRPRRTASRWPWGRQRRPLRGGGDLARPGPADGGGSGDHSCGTGPGITPDVAALTDLTGRGSDRFHGPWQHRGSRRAGPV